MRMKVRQVVLFLTLIVILSACNQNGQEQVNEPDTLTMIDVEIFLEEDIAVNEATVITAEVTQGEQPIEDADEVVFEVWTLGSKEASEMIEGTHSENGMYEMEYSFLEEDIYYVQAHVTARNMHVMPQQEVIVGDFTDEELAEIFEDGQEEATDDEEEEMDHSGH
ncbi:hypothetical protein AJ85_00620 [Alkalihalobacillus alcalophilus ATCC 27647 = CGMCC 1.3604]|uniref:YtkA-like domain-containing protein n=1 Tax=Alkalihalobacillus alcalophilus ATCC 27647 = CGMCC 1.3604 TaxID=1218173 RepID=A0A4S4JWP8_ALKAL|nr:FixH family protein [Alkalihalobacillus alcalophilus]MED1560884.1 FixH family protein [Alkalihalobacillus alcalophilus]THG88697.1 hypothetical protein AJ85_00620 [Alkalihalobacillus alcalophilus ATCC 27647 = CGMCC 1.3604]